MFIVLLYTFYGKLSNAFISFSRFRKIWRTLRKRAQLRALDFILM